MSKIFEEYIPIDYSQMRSGDFLSRMNQSNLSAIDRVEKGHGFKTVKACNFCGSGKSKLFLHKNSIDIVECTECGLIYSSVVPKNFNDLYSDEEYLSTTLEMYEKNSTFRKQRFGEERLNIIKKFKQSGTILDIGCGIGWFLEVAKDTFNVVGVEISDSLRNYLKEKKGIPSYKALNFVDDNSADVVTGFDLIEHVLDPYDLLNTIYRVLKPKGICLLYTPNVDSVGFKLLKEKNSLLCPPEHLYYFNKSTLTKYAEKACFEILKVWTKGIDVGDMYAMELSSRNERIAEYLSENQNWMQHSIDEAGFGNHMRILLKKN